VTRPGIFGNPFHQASSFKRWITSGEIAVLDLRSRSFFPWGDEAKERLRQKRDAILKGLSRLTGKQVMCFCGLDQECHGDVLARMANRMAMEFSITPELANDTKRVLKEYCKHVYVDEAQRRDFRLVSDIDVDVKKLNGNGMYAVCVSGDTLPLQLKLETSDHGS
jgi:hypothetical protein